MKVQRGAEVQLHSFLISAIDGVNDQLLAPAALPEEATVPKESEARCTTAAVWALWRGEKCVAAVGN